MKNKLTQSARRYLALVRQIPMQGSHVMQKSAEYRTADQYHRALIEEFGYDTARREIEKLK